MAVSIGRLPLVPAKAGIRRSLDGDAAIRWWHRNVAISGYGLQDWKRGRIYRDFIFALGGEGAEKRIVALETKGNHLQNPDTDYKRDVLKFLSESFAWDDVVPRWTTSVTEYGRKGGMHTDPDARHRYKAANISCGTGLRPTLSGQFQSVVCMPSARKGG